MQSLAQSVRLLSPEQIYIIIIMKVGKKRKEEINMDVNKNIDMVKTSAKMMSKGIAEELISKIKLIGTQINTIQIVKTEIINSNILWVQLLLFDNDVLPIKVDILKNIFMSPVTNIYLSPGTALNTETNFITPNNKNLAVFLANKGYTVIGITPREDAATPGFNFSLMKDWGLQKHTDDFNEIVTIFQNIGNMNYEILGHSAGALVVLNYASQIHDNRLNAVRVIDIVGQYPPDSQNFQYSQISMNAVNQVINSGTFIDPGFQGFEFLAQQAQNDPNGDSGVPRPVGGDFTNIGLLYFALINTNVLPGILTPTTGLPGNWQFVQGFLAGTYKFGPLPTEDVFSFTHTDIQTIYNSLTSLGSGIVPLAYDRDFFALLSNQFPLAWNNIKVPVFYINTGLGFGDASYTVGLLTNSNVTYGIVNDYGHADPVYSNTADVDFWAKLFP